MIACVASDNFSVSLIFSNPPPAPPLSLSHTHTHVVLLELSNLGFLGVFYRDLCLPIRLDWLPSKPHGFPCVSLQPHSRHQSAFFYIDAGGQTRGPFLDSQHMTSWPSPELLVPIIQHDNVSTLYCVCVIVPHSDNSAETPPLRLFMLWTVVFWLHKSFLLV